MNIATKKQNIVQWIQGTDDEKTIEKMLSFKDESDFSLLENQLIQKGLNDIHTGNVSSHEDVKKHFKVKFAKK